MRRAFGKPRPDDSSFLPTESHLENFTSGMYTKDPKAYPSCMAVRRERMGVISSVAARELGISSRTICNWADRGLIKAQRSVCGWRLFDMQDVERLKSELEAKRKDA